jgi:hypothetical protein
MENGKERSWNQGNKQDKIKRGNWDDGTRRGENLLMK